jgi:putative ABC transport system permease protein
MASISMVLGGVAGIALLVGGIGIMNIMLVSVTERTREIGIRLAIGARARDVLTQFLVESIALSTLGGAIGLVIGVGGTWLVTWQLDMPFVISPTVMAVGFSFSVAIGVIFGYFPARKAAMLNPIDALRHE